MPEAPTAVISQATLTVGILAGGEGRRVGGADKGLLPFNNQPLIAHVLHSLQQQLPNTARLISANRHLHQYQTYATTVPDNPAHQGPLAGIAALLKHCESDWLLTIPCDCPKLPPNFGAKLAQFLLNANNNESLAVVNDGQRDQNAVLLIRQNHVTDLENHLENSNGAIYSWLTAHAPTRLIFDNWPSHYWRANTIAALQAIIND